ncbi:uncharacterized protein LOC130051280 [Ostrea edulis]|uniref:uncharacterized protein LOC130051280 n=1 Tax=Ostrea edulis TaxID=37623 RepID=UPI0024AEAD71|nr:uncharacterized protein LOC130051280 [Ostrea edulis]
MPKRKGEAQPSSRGRKRRIPATVTVSEPERIDDQGQAAGVNDNPPPRFTDEQMQQITDAISAGMTASVTKAPIPVRATDASVNCESTPPGNCIFKTSIEWKLDK